SLFIIALCGKEGEGGVGDPVGAGKLGVAEIVQEQFLVEFEIGDRIGKASSTRMTHGNIRKLHPYLDGGSHLIHVKMNLFFLFLNDCFFEHEDKNSFMEIKLGMFLVICLFIFLYSYSFFSLFLSL
ncbi:hypothetical protein ACJX0J_021463, partial [Zea mays]